MFYLTVIHLFYVFITCRVSHAFSWKFLKPHMFAIVQDVLFPILSYSQADEELWNTDPYEYIRVKFGKNISRMLLCYLFHQSVMYVCTCMHMCGHTHRRVDSLLTWTSTLFMENSGNTCCHLTVPLPMSVQWRQYNMTSDLVTPSVLHCCVSIFIVKEKVYQRSDCYGWMTEVQFLPGIMSQDQI
jgi:hypothetical protein